MPKLCKVVLGAAPLRQTRFNLKFIYVCATLARLRHHPCQQRMWAAVAQTYYSYPPFNLPTHLHNPECSRVSGYLRLKLRLPLLKLSISLHHAPSLLVQPLCPLLKSCRAPLKGCLLLLSCLLSRVLLRLSAWWQNASVHGHGKN